MNNLRVLRNSNAVLYTMPSLDDESEAGIEESSESIQKRAYEEGFVSGEKAGLTEGRQKSGIIAEQLIRLTEEIAALKQDLSKKLESQMVELAFAVARKIVIEEIRTNPEVIAGMVKDALKRIRKSNTVTIRINPAVYDILLEKKKDIAGIHDEIVFELDKGIMPEGPLVISQTEEVVTDIDSLLGNIKEDIITAVKSERESKPEDAVD